MPSKGNQQERSGSTTALPLFRTRARIEQLASDISDPIERLRFLRGEMTPAHPPVPVIPVFVMPQPFWLRILKRPELAVAMTATLALISLYALAVSRRAIEVRPMILPPPIQLPVTAKASTGVWLVDQKGDLEIYSNGLRIETRFTTPNIPRAPFKVYDIAQPDRNHAHTRQMPAGIVFHTTESLLVPFEQGQNDELKRIGNVLLNFLRANHCYHYLIDRFGRVYRVVKESDVAFHAGHSVWADDETVYIGLNTSFLGVAFETRSEPGHTIPSATPAQIDSARVLTEMLREKYKIPAVDCATHAQVSVNPSNMLIGYHTDWAGNFPFLEVGLPDNYARPPAALSAFGFSYDPAFVNSTGTRLLPGLLLAESDVRNRANRLHRPLPEVIAALQNNYREIAGSESAQGDSK